MSEENPEVKYADVPSEEWIRYMATFYRALTASERYVEANNLIGIWFDGRILDALHNVPDMLCYCREMLQKLPSELPDKYKAAGQEFFAKIYEI